MTRFRKLALATTATTYLLIAAGGLVRATGSGLGCPTWPGCYPGRFFPPLEKAAMIEWTHRTIVVFLTIMIAAMTVWALRRFRAERPVMVPSVAAFGLVLFQAALGAITVERELDPVVVTAHFATAMVLVGTLISATIATFRLREVTGPRVQADFAQLALVAAAGTFILLLVGAYVRGLGAGLAFPDWPLMNGRLLPQAGRIETPHFVHRLLALFAGALVVALAWRSNRTASRDAHPRPVRLLALAAAGLYLVQAFVGALNVWTDLSEPTIVAHVALAALSWGAVLGLAVVSRGLSRQNEQDVDATSPERAASGRGLGRAKAVVATYFRLTKPRIIVLLLITTVPTMMVAFRGWPGLGLVLATLLGGSLAAGGANAINCYVDRDIDAKMGRTSRRPLPAGEVTPARALEFGIALGIVSFAYLWTFVNLLSAALALSALLFYVFVYTIGLKRSTPQNIVIGGAAGAVPVLVGWAAVTGTLTWAPVVMFLIVFFWTPPHFWALALRFSGDYAKAGVPMLPVVAGRRETLKQILLYTVVLVAVTLALTPIGDMGMVYLAAAAALGAWFIRGAAILWRRDTNQAAWSLFKLSINYLALLFVAMAVDSVVHVAVA
ncbi:MAG TPA: heme o synthase [Actinomycetota bacterium]|nr:heme o synthase [Actinomycetota bacterium]